ncbi:hypothetical protein D3C72_824680 [compost metagenome]
MRERIKGQARFAVWLPGHGRCHQVVFRARGVRLIVAFRRFAQQTIVPVAVGNLPGGIEIALCQIARPGVEAHFRLRGVLRLFALNIDQPARRAAAVQHRGGAFKDVHALDQQRIDARFGVPGDIVGQLQTVVILLLDGEPTDLIFTHIGGIAAHFRRHARRIAQDFVDRIRVTLFDLRGGNSVDDLWGFTLGNG